MIEHSILWAVSCAQTQATGCMLGAAIEVGLNRMEERA